MGNKSDLVRQKVVSFVDGKEFADTYGMHFLEASAKTATNVDHAFLTMTAAIMGSIERAGVAGRTLAHAPDPGPAAWPGQPLPDPAPEHACSDPSIATAAITWENEKERSTGQPL